MAVDQPRNNQKIVRIDDFCFRCRDLRGDGSNPVSLYQNVATFIRSLSVGPRPDQTPFDQIRLLTSNRLSARISAAAAMCSASEYSCGKWLYPPLLGTKNIIVFVT